MYLNDSNDPAQGSSTISGIQPSAGEGTSFLEGSLATAEGIQCEEPALGVLPEMLDLMNVKSRKIKGSMERSSEFCCAGILILDSTSKLFGPISGLQLDFIYFICMHLILVHLAHGFILTIDTSERFRFKKSYHHHFEMTLLLMLADLATKKGWISSQLSWARWVLP